MGFEAALFVGAMAAGGAVLASSMNKSKDPGTAPKVQPVKTEVAEAKRQEVFSQMAKLRKQTLLAKRDMPEPVVKKTVLGAGI